MEYGYRTESAYGSGERRLDHILRFEIFELGNLDFIDMLLKNYGIDDLNAEVVSYRLFSEIDLLADATEAEQLAFVNKLLNFIQSKLNIKLKYGLWLASLEAVEHLYADSQDSDIMKYKTSPYILSDLGYDGTLYAYEELPKPTKIF